MKKKDLFVPYLEASKKKKKVACCDFLASCLDEWPLATTGTHTFGAIEHVREVKLANEQEKKKTKGGKRGSLERKGGGKKVSSGMNDSVRI
jgi:hypothetical protein